MIKKTEYTRPELIEKVESLQPGESLVAISKEVRGKFFIHIGDKRYTNTWSVCKEELLELQRLLNNKFN